MDRPSRLLGQSPAEPHHAGTAARLNRLRAGVLGANDGIVSVAGVVVGVAGATGARPAIAIAGAAALAAGALSMAVGEYVSVSSQRDSERALLDLERRELAEAPEEELEELAGLHRANGLSDGLARAVAAEQTAHDALAAHARVELGIDPDALVNPWHASLAAFLVGGALPLVAVLAPAVAARVPVTVASVLAALALTGVLAARLGRAPVPPAVVRNLVGGGLAMAITFGVGNVVGLAV
ncbi:VIT1/CCC1 transporter family protein [Cellulomonas aerilata]|uniref:Membrane protein n=1 Tax=Cellulomonas aerilata TaxID=515326 RepID=A0A512DGY0_9CELL|nr:VIT1/CCC1 transporter family protein [Cellulomonas aerilata]GEO35731.1 membrane protein [Cellulomonas aerilata]